ncbi:DUF397 domain-containing protein [Streptomyces sp. NPDC001553]|uniref:DUF397 domain-containing protein n=1 Tax=Streptomyces sp. NPDC001553 TaxID=3154385 RepID=UPI003324AFAE
MSATIANSGLPWRKSSYSGNSEGQCVEVADLALAGMEGIGVRDSKNPSGPILKLGRTAFTVFIADTRSSEAPA